MLLLLIICLFSIFLYLYFTYKLDIKKIILKQGVFNLSNTTYEFDFDKLTHDRYNVILRFYNHKKIDPDFVFNLLSKKVKYLINVEVRDRKGNLIKEGAITPDGRTSGGGSQEYFDWHLFFFIGERAQEYNLRLLLQSNEAFFDKVEKEIYIEEDYDYASAPWWGLFQRIFLITCIITLLPILIIGFIWLKKKI